MRLVHLRDALRGDPPVVDEIKAKILEMAVGLRPIPLYIAVPHGWSVWAPIGDRNEIDSPGALVAIAYEAGLDRFCFPPPVPQSDIRFLLLSNAHVSDLAAGGTARVQRFEGGLQQADAQVKDENPLVPASAIPPFRLRPRSFVPKRPSSQLETLGLGDDASYELVIHLDDIYLDEAVVALLCRNFQLPLASMPLCVPSSTAPMSPINRDPYGLKGRAEGVRTLLDVAQAHFEWVKSPIDQPLGRLNVQHAFSKRVPRLFGEVRSKHAATLIRIKQRRGRNKPLPPFTREANRVLSTEFAERPFFVSDPLALIIHATKLYLRWKTEAGAKARLPGSRTPEIDLQRLLSGLGFTAKSELKAAFAIITWDGTKFKHPPESA